jgi:preprotein translocase subunit SecE
VARDRQRSSKGRRKRPSGSAGNPAKGSAKSRARDIGLDDPSIDESGLTDTTPAPDPLKNSSADVDQARAAETGAGRGPAGDEVDLGGDDVFDDDDFEHAEDEAEADLVPSGPGRGGVDPAVAEERAPHRKERGRLLTFLRHCVDELRRVQWPDRRQVGQGTLVTLLFVLVAGGYLGLLDAIWKPIMEAIL